ncbi:hypothetical protein KO528_12560 [Saccharophagus degradans]|uniref:hypothetical protein n=1 Tax=Saccharophagus degradans TaxID=86304 RepID=UPI001C08155F|nr:hypothetical protein [Saccharophagus degradans]MBU2986185.1 hypothetical protein [Saccharophagus degradans]
MKKFITLIKRECWEHKTSFFIVPIIMPLLILLFFSIADGSCEFSEKNTHCDFNNIGAEQGVNAADALLMLESSTGEAERFIEVFMFVITVPVAVIMLLVMLSYLMSCLVDERKDKSILFWNSLPVSQTQIMLSKLVSALVLIPTVSLVVSMVLQLLMAGVLYFRMSVGGEVLIQSWHDINMLSLLAAQLVNYLVFMLAAFALAGWLLLVSSYFNRPLIMTVLILCAIAVVEALIMGWGSHEIRGVILDAALGSSSLFGYGLPENAMDFTKHNVFGLLTQQAVKSLSEPRIWIVAIVGASLTAAAINVRKYRGAMN